MRMTRTLNLSFLFLILLFFCFAPIKSAYSQFSCIPTCDETDGRMLTFAAGASLQTINNQNVEVRIVSPVGSDTLEIGIFDGDTMVPDDFTYWDKAQGRPAIILDYTLILDPEGTGMGNGTVIATWSSDGSFGDNVGDPMPDNQWFIRELQNSPGAQTEDGSYSYRLEVSIANPDPDPAGEALSPFKLRADGVISIIAGSAFNYIVTLENFFDIITIYPDINFDDPTCFGPGLPGFYCNPGDPECCLNNTPYNGTWKFCMIVPEGLNTLDIWDGDFDYGSDSFDSVDPFFCNAPDGISLDTNDQNTPIALPPWSAGTDVIQQGVSVPTAPPDDNGCFPLQLRSPSVNYNLVGPNGVSYTNVNPSGNIEWELFNISTEPFNPDLYDIHVDSIEGGLWCVEVFGNDVRNLNSIRLPFDMFGLDENDEPVLPGPNDPAMVPTLSEYGLIVMAGILGFVAFIAIRRKQATA
ncbi:MAG: hypothetical protein DHS20C13_02390 [Thermodesulfobacteriota bacterium]|nr:MAG: hypothetical protein DHS20C13_02390 [Thermodesulfobacteriota bacterium]